MIAHLSVATMIWMFIGVCLAQALSVGWVARKDDRDGLRTWALALCVHASAYGLLALRGSVADVVSIVVSNTLISVAYSLYWRSVLRFLGRPIALWTLVLPPAIMAAAYVMMMDSLRGRILFGGALLFAQGLAIAATLMRAKFDYPLRGRNLMLFAMALALTAGLLRIAIVALRPQDMSTLFQASQAQTATYSIAFFAIILVTNGFVLMTKERSDEALRNAAMKDKLTGCWNRIRIEEMGEQELARLTRYGHPVSMMMIDIDHFKQVNDRYGHIAGDAVLRGFSELARATIRTTDVIGRWGGEEFVVILPSCSIQDVLPLAERLRIALQHHLFDDGLYVTASIGIALARSTDTWQDWLNRADTALYSAKNAGRNRTWIENLVIDSNRLVEGALGYRLQWRAVYETGNPDIDSEHRAIFETANTLLSLGTHPHDKAEVLALAEPLLKSVKTHFFHEDRALLCVQDNPVTRAHIEMHKYLSQRADNLLQRFKTDTVGVAGLFHFIVFEYITQHILIEDRKIAPLLATAARD